MNKTIKKWLIAAAVLTVLGQITFVAAMAELNFDFTKLSTIKYETNTYEVNSDFDKISVDVDITDIVFKQSNDESCKVVCLEADKMKHSVRCKDGTLTIDVNDERKWYEHIGISFAGPKMTVYLPQSEYTSLLIDTATGDIDIPKSFTFNELEIKTNTGTVDCMANVSDSIKIKSNTGNIGISSVSSECNINIKTDTGAIKLTDIACTNFTAESDTGNITLTNVVAADRINVESDTGNIKLKDSDAAKLSIETDTGNVTGTLLSEKIFTAKSSTGHISVPDSETGGKCEIKTATGNIKIDIR